MSFGRHNEKNEMDGPGGKFEREERYIMEFSGKPREKEISWKT